MEALIKQLLDLAASAPPELNGTAGTIRITASALQFSLETREALAHQLRSFAAENRRSSVRLAALPLTAALFVRAAELQERAADVLDARPVAEVA